LNDESDPSLLKHNMLFTCDSVSLVAQFKECDDLELRDFEFILFEPEEERNKPPPLPRRNWNWSKHKQTNLKHLRRVSRESMRTLPATGSLPYPSKYA
jgi:hypothetical protein